MRKYERKRRWMQTGMAMLFAVLLSLTCQSEFKAAEIGTEQDIVRTEDSADKEEQGRWVQKKNGWRYQNSKGEYLSDCWKKISGSWYAFDEKGYMREGWFCDGDTWYYLELQKGTMVTGWLYDGGKWYYMDADGAMIVGWVYDNGKWYYMDADGVMVTGWLSDNDKWYYMNEKGEMVTGWLCENNKWYYMNDNGMMVTSWVNDNGKWYYMNEKGAMTIGWANEGNKWYYMDTEGVMVTGWVYDNGKWYYMNEKGVMFTGWLSDNDKWYYMNENGAMVTGWLIQGDKRYYMDETGAMTTVTDATLIKRKGIDVSKWQGEIDWAKAKAEGVEFAIIRVGYRSDSTGILEEDPYYIKNIEGALEQGIRVGVYIFSQAITVEEAREEANYVLSRIQGYDITLPIAIDVEYLFTANGEAGRLYDANLSVEAATEICSAFCETVESAGYTGMVYANKYMLTNKLDAEKLAENYCIWLAHYTSETNYEGEYDFWQYSATGDGYLHGMESQNLDMNWWYDDGSM